MTNRFLPTLPADVDQQQELLIRFFASLLATVLYFSLEIGIDTSEKNKSGSVVFNSIMAIVNTAALAFLFRSLRKNNTPLTTSSQLAAAANTFSATLVLSAAGGASMSVGNRAYMAGIIEGAFGLFGLTLMATMAVVQHCYPNSQTKTSLLDFLTYRYATSEQRMTVAGVAFGGILNSLVFTYFAFQQRDYGTAASGCLSVATTTGLFVKTIHNETSSANNQFSVVKMMPSTAISAGIGFLLNAVSDHLNHKQNSQVIGEAIAGAALLALIITYKVYQRCKRAPAQMETQTLLPAHEV